MAISTISSAGLATGGIGRTNMYAGAVLQVVSTDYTGTASSASATPADVSGFSATITPTSSTSKILAMVTVCFGGGNDTYPYVLLKRNGTSLSVGVSATGVQLNTFLGAYFTALGGTVAYTIKVASKNYLDSPATTSALTYQIQLASPYVGTGYINRQSTLDNAVYTQYPTSSITLMEIAA